MIPEPGDMKHYALALEQAMAMRGWDEPPLLGVVLRTKAKVVFEEMPHDDLDPDSTIYGLAPFPVQAQDFDADTAVALAGIAAVYSDPASGPPPIPPAEYGELCGLVFACEGWSNEDPNLKPEGRSLADIPGSVEVRSVYLIDCGGRAYMAERKRGRDPVVVQIEEPEYFTGRVPIAMRDLMLALTRDMMDGVDIVAMSRVGTA